MFDVNKLSAHLKEEIKRNDKNQEYFAIQGKKKNAKMYEHMNYSLTMLVNKIDNGDFDKEETITDRCMTQCELVKKTLERIGK